MTENAEKPELKIEMEDLRGNPHRFYVKTSESGVCVIRDATEEYRKEMDELERTWLNTKDGVIVRMADNQQAKSYSYLHLNDQWVKLERINEISCYNLNYYRPVRNYPVNEVLQFDPNCIIQDKCYEDSNWEEYSFGYLDENNKFHDLMTFGTSAEGDDRLIWAEFEMDEKILAKIR